MGQEFLISGSLWMYIVTCIHLHFGWWSFTHSLHDLYTWLMMQLPRFKLLEAAQLMAKRQELSLKAKLKKTPPNSSQRELAEICKLPRNTLTRLINKEEELRSRWCEVFWHCHKPAKKLKRLRKGKAPEVDTALNQWFGTVTSKG